MFALYSKGCEYVLRALVCAVSEAPDTRFRVEDVCKKADVPEFFTRKSFQALAQKGYLHTVRGPGGGYQLALDPQKIVILDLIKAVEGDETFEKCAMGLDHCSDESACPIHGVWKKLRRVLLAELGQTTLKQLIHAAHKKKSSQSRQSKKLRA